MLTILLKSTQMAENTGMAIRAMVNTGVKELRLIAPQHDWPNQKAHLASAEKSHLINVAVFDSLQDAIKDLNIVFAATARRRNMISQIYSPDVICNRDYQNCNVGVLFGSEKDGLSNDDISMCNAIIEIPSADFSSYNLAQAVLLVCYQHLINSETNELHTGKTTLATQEHIDAFVNLLEKKLQDANYFPPDNKKVLMMQTLRGFFKRSTPTAQEIQSLFGAISAL